jgi:hypothetical protein
LVEVLLVLVELLVVVELVEVVLLLLRGGAAVAGWRS